jgi:uncharacterized protein YdbL (DUF1318 family)
MNIRSMKAAFPAVLILSFLACITVNIYFPESAVKKTAEDIVNEVRGTGQKIKDEVKKDEVKKSASFSLLPSLYAQQETEVTTPKIRAVKESLRGRFNGLVPFYDAGRIGETRDGNIQVLNEDGLSLQEKSVLRKLSSDENQDRADLYAEVAKALNIEAGQIGRIRQIFAEQWIGKARAGWMVQNADGGWAKK